MTAVIYLWYYGNVIKVLSTIDKLTYRLYGEFKERRKEKMKIILSENTQAKVLEIMAQAVRLNQTTEHRFDITLRGGAYINATMRIEKEVEGSDEFMTLFFAQHGIRCFKDGTSGYLISRVLWLHEAKPQDFDDFFEFFEEMAKMTADEVETWIKDTSEKLDAEVENNEHNV